MICRLLVGRLEKFAVLTIVSHLFWKVTKLRNNLQDNGLV